MQRGSGEEEGDGVGKGWEGPLSFTKKEGERLGEEHMRARPEACLRCPVRGRGPGSVW